MESKIQEWNEPLIRDGFAQRYYIKEQERLYPEVRFTARPLTFAEVEEHEAFFQEESDPIKAAGRVIKVLAKQIQAWSWSDKPSIETIRRIRRPQLLLMYAMVASKAASHEDMTIATTTSDDSDVDAAGIERFEEQLGKS